MPKTAHRRTPKRQAKKTGKHRRIGKGPFDIPYYNEIKKMTGRGGKRRGGDYTWDIMNGLKKRGGNWFTNALDKGYTATMDKISADPVFGNPMITGYATKVLSDGINSLTKKKTQGGGKRKRRGGWNPLQYMLQSPAQNAMDNMFGWNK
jgi:hypothetical protein